MDLGKYEDDISNQYLPQYSSIFELYHKLEQRSTYLNEIETRIKKKKIKNELKEMRKNLSSILFNEHQTQLLILQNWFHEMQEYDSKWVSKKSNFTWKDDRKFYDINYSENSDCKMLSFGTRFNGRCTRILISEKNTSKSHTLEVTSSNGFLVNENIGEIDTASQFVDQVWKKINILNSYFENAEE